MFSVYLLFLFVVVLTLVPRAFPDVARTYNADYYLAVSIILFLTLWFAHLSDSIAEAQGKAQADSLREIQSGIRARQIRPDGSPVWLASDALRVGDTVEIRPGEPIPIDGDVIHGAALIDESMMTGESEAVTRESGGDKTSVLGGTRVLQGTIQVRVTTEKGESFLDRMIRLVEGQGRDRTPNELALGVLLYAFTIALFSVVVTFIFLADFTDIIYVDIATIVALFVCLMPTTIGALLPAIGISGINRVARANVIAKSGKAVEAAGDLDVLILDKTGTITVGNRLAVQLVVAPDVPMAELLEAAMLCSSLDDTPEGRSIVRLAARRGVQPGRLEPGTFRILPFTAERRMSGIVLADGREVFKGSLQAMESYGAVLPLELRRKAAEASRQGMTPLAISSGKRAIGLVYLKDVVKPGIRDRLRELRTMGIRTIMCTGDNRLTAAAIAQESGVDDFETIEPSFQDHAAGRILRNTGSLPARLTWPGHFGHASGLSTTKPVKNQIKVANCRRKPFFSAKIVSIKLKCPTFRRAFCQHFVCFHIHSGFDRIIFKIFFWSMPCRTFTDI